MFPWVPKRTLPLSLGIVGVREGVVRSHYHCVDLARKNMMVMVGWVVRVQRGLAAPEGTEVVWAPQEGQGLAAGVHPTTHPGSRAAGGHWGCSP